jgi:hypothetical protein
MPPPTPSTVPIAAWLGTWSRPTDGPGRVALALSVLLLAVALFPRGLRILLSLFDLASVADLTRRRPFLIVGSFAAAFLSLGCIAFYLRGGPRAPDAATYWLEGHALSHGALSWAIPGPTASFRAAGLHFRVPDRVSGVYPPGYPLLLAMGFLVGAPMLIGPLLAAALVVATWLLAHEVLAGADVDGATPGIRRGGGNSWPQGGERAEAVARLAAGLSILSAALRYHTADALPDGAAALAVSSALACGLRARRTGDARFFAAAGLAVGLLVASSPASAIAVGAMVAVLATGSSRRARALVWMCVAALPGVLLLVASNHAATGHALQFPPTHLAAADGIAAGTTPAVVSMVRVAVDHLRDVANLEPLALVALAPLIGETRLRAASLVALVILGQVLVRVVVGVHSMPVGAEARPLVCIAPLEHVLIALGIARSFPRAFAAAAVSTLALSLGGFAVHASHVLQAVAGHDIGRPRFEPDVVREANVTQGLLFFDDDEGYELAHDPVVSASHGIESARMRGDDHDRLLFDSLGHPPVHEYVAAGARASLTGWAPPNTGSNTWRFEAESDWPPVAHGGEVADALIVASDCASGGRVLRVAPRGAGGPASVLIELPVPRGTVPPEKRVWIVTPRVLQQGGRGQGVVALVTEPGSTPLAEWTWSDSDAQSSCVDLPAKPIELGGDHARAWLVVRAAGGSIQYDKTTLSPR